MPRLPANIFHVSPTYQPLLRQVGLDADAVFDHPDIVVWRSIAERENCTLDATLADGRAVRLHVKRHKPAGGAMTPADEEADGIRALQSAGIATVPLIGWGRVEDGRSFLITEDLAGYNAADKLIAAGTPFESLLGPTAATAARLHSAGLHHRDLYLCHFFAKFEGERVADLRLIDAARVRRLPGWPTRRRWVVKDLAQFWYSTLSLPINDEQRGRWLDRYATERGTKGVGRLRASVERKSNRIARHDKKLREAQPGRNISIPQ